VQNVLGIGGHLVARSKEIFALSQQTLRGSFRKERVQSKAQVCCSVLLLFGRLL